MTDSNKQPASASKTPSHAAYHVRDREGSDAIWTRLCAALPRQLVTPNTDARRGGASRFSVTGSPFLLRSPS
jgi:hypothetical protein